MDAKAVRESQRAANSASWRSGMKGLQGEIRAGYRAMFAEEGAESAARYSASVKARREAEDKRVSEARRLAHPLLAKALAKGTPDERAKAWLLGVLPCCAWGECKATELVEVFAKAESIALTTSASVLRRAARSLGIVRRREGRAASGMTWSLPADAAPDGESSPSPTLLHPVAETEARLASYAPTPWSTGWLAVRLYFAMRDRLRNVDGRWMHKGRGQRTWHDVGSMRVEQLVRDWQRSIATEYARTEQGEQERFDAKARAEARARVVAEREHAGRKVRVYAEAKAKSAGARAVMATTGGRLAAVATRQKLLDALREMLASEMRVGP
jgi:hypothetical protein